MTVSSLKQRKMIHFSKSFQCWTNKSKVRSCRHCYALITSQDTAYISIKKLLLQTLGDIQQLRGPNSTQFWFSSPSSGQTWTSYIPSTLCQVTHTWFFYWPPPRLIVHVLIECPLAVKIATDRRRIRCRNKCFKPQEISVCLNIVNVFTFEFSWWQSGPFLHQNTIVWDKEVFMSYFKNVIKIHSPQSPLRISLGT